MSRYREVAEIVLRYLEHRDRLVRLSITSLLPRIAHFLRDRFWVHCSWRDGELDGELIHYLPIITIHLREAIAPRRIKPSLEALACVGSIAKAMGSAMEPHVRGLLDIMFSTGLSTVLVEALEQISTSIPSLLPTIQDRLLDNISMHSEFGGKMFSPSMDSARDAGGVAGTVLIPMRFVWPYGGRSVYLTGSFTRIRELFAEYKFYVDGEWQHDEHQPCLSGEYGIVNTVLLATDPNFVPVLTPDIVSGSNMDVDNEAFRRMVRLTDGTLSNVLLPRVSDVDVQTSRQRISSFLSTCTAYELLPESGKVVTLDVDLPVKQAFHILHEQGIPMAPLWDICKGQFVGVLSALDFILILRELGNHGSNLTEEELETHTISAWKEGKWTAFTQCFIRAGPNDNLKEIAVKILQNGISTVPIIHSSSEDGSFPQLLHLASLSGILKCICRYFRNCSTSLPILQLPICAIPVGTWVPKIGESNCQPLAMLRPNASLTSALNLLVQAQVSSVPIVDDSDSLLDIYCRSDITALAKDRTYTHINLDEMTVHQALQLGQDFYSPYEARSQRCQMCLRTDSLYKVMEHLNLKNAALDSGVRRLVIVEAGSKRVEGIISLSDIFKFFLVRQPPSAQPRPLRRDSRAFTR
ncbi:unnamed protein product [Sphenostylis stenocarpa]|uniref:CBS domain-containing protein n=1 Tax=Sphenostylis stenocarpa TaxID=92480 RepID=A0AA86S6E6_9FABA|nr:unnamed protein product [Sphenostylis stenocarpa]